MSENIFLTANKGFSILKEKVNIYFNKNDEK